MAASAWSPNGETVVVDPTLRTQLLDPVFGTKLISHIRNMVGGVGHGLDKWLDYQETQPFAAMTDAQIADVQAGTLTLDMTSAIQKAIDSVAVHVCKGRVKLPAGKYKITSNLNIPYGVSLTGEGGTASELVAYNCDGIRFTSYGYQIGEMYYEDFGITSGAGANYTGISALANASTMDGLHFKGIRFYGFNECIDLAANWNCTISECFGQNINVGIVLASVCVGIRMNNNVFTCGAGGNGAAAKTGIHVRGGTILESLHFFQNQIYGFNVAIDLGLSTYVNIIDNDLSALVTTLAYTTVNGTFNVSHNYFEAFGKGVTAAAQAVPTPAIQVNLIYNTFIGQGGTATVGLEINTSIGTNQFDTLVAYNSFSGFILHDIRNYSPGKTTFHENRCMSNVPAYSMWIGGVIAGPVTLSKNWCFKDIYYDVPADHTNGLIITDHNTTNNTYIPYHGTFAGSYASQVGAFGAITYAYNNGQFDRIGNVCYFQMTIVASALAVGTAANSAYINLGTLPFTPAATVQATAACIADCSGWGANTPSSASIASGSKNVNLNFRATANGPTAVLQVADMATGAGTLNRITLSGWFLCTPQ